MVFERRGLDWRWESAIGLSAWTREAEKALPPQPAGPAQVLQLQGAPGLATWALDRAARGAGWTVGWLDHRSPSLVPAEIELVRLVTPQGPRVGPSVRWVPSGEPERFENVAPRVGEAPGSVLVCSQGRLATWTSELLRQGAERLLQDLGNSGSYRQDVLVLHRPWCEPGSRLLLSWAEASGAALLLEPDGEQAWPSLVWARPTVVAATADEWGTWATWLGSRSIVDWTGPRRPFGRLRALVTLADGTQETAGPLPAPWLELAAVRGAHVVSAG